MTGFDSRALSGAGQAARQPEGGPVCCWAHWHVLTRLAVKAALTAGDVMALDVCLITTGRLYSIKNYPQIIHTLQELCGQGLVMRFGKAAFENPEIGHRLAELLPAIGS